MDPKDFHNPETGRVVQTPQDYAAFIPAPLPPKLVYDTKLVVALSRADSALSELSGLGRQLPNPHLLIAPYVRREAVLSSRIEGIRARGGSKKIILVRLRRAIRGATSGSGLDGQG